MTRKSTLSAESVEVIDHLKARGRQTTAQLLSHFAGVPRTVLGKRLRNLCALGWLDFAATDAGERIWFVRSSARAIVARTSEPEAPRQSKEVLPIVEPRRVNVMAGVYVPQRGPALRPGALDFKACQSVGYRC